MARRLVQGDVLAERVPHSGAWVLSATASDGSHHRKTYYGYSKRDALSRFVSEVNAGDNDYDKIRTHMKANAPLKGAQQIGSNMTEVEHGDLTILYSYKTPVAFLAPQGGYVTEHRWSVTTSKHIAKFFDRHGYDRKGAHKLPQEDLEAMVSVGEVAGAKRLGHAPLERRGNPRAYVTGEFGDAEDYEARIEADVEQAQPDDFAPYDHPGKFEGEPLIILRLHEMSQMGGDEELGEVDCFGWYSLLTGVKTSDGVLHFIVHEDNNGFFGIHESATDEKVINDVWSGLQDEYDESGCAEGDD